MADMGDESVPEVADPTVISSVEHDPSITIEDSDPKQSAAEKHIKVGLATLVEDVDKNDEECEAIATEIPTSTSESNSNGSFNLHELEETKEAEEISRQEPEVHIKCTEVPIEVDMPGTEELLSSNISNENEGVEEKPSEVILVSNKETTSEDTINIQEETLETDEKEKDESTKSSIPVEGTTSEGLREEDTSVLEPCEKNEIDESLVGASKSEGHVDSDLAQSIVGTGNNVDAISIDNSTGISILNPIEKTIELISLEKESDPINIEDIIAVQHFVDTEEGTDGIAEELEIRKSNPLGEDIEAKDLMVVELFEPKQEVPIAESISHDLIEEIDVPISVDKENDQINIENKEATNIVGAELEVRNCESLGDDIKSKDLPIVDLSELQQEVEEKYIDHLAEDIDEPILYEEVLLIESTASCEKSVEPNNINEPQTKNDEYDKLVEQNELHQSKESENLVENIEGKESTVQGEQVLNNNSTTSCEANIAVEEAIMEEEKIECLGQRIGVEGLTSAANENQLEVQETLLAENSKELDYPIANTEITISNKEVEEVKESVLVTDIATLQTNEEPSQRVNEVAHSMPGDNLLALQTQESSHDKEYEDQDKGTISIEDVNQEDIHEIVKENCTISNEVQEIASFVVEAVNIEDSILIVHEATTQVRNKAQEHSIVQEESYEDMPINRDIEKIHEDPEDATDEAQMQCITLSKVPSRDDNDFISIYSKSIDKMENGSDDRVLPPIISPCSVEQTCEDNILVASAIVKDRVPENPMKEETLETKMGVVIEEASIWPITLEEALKRNWFRFLDVICLRAS